MWHRILSWFSDRKDRRDLVKDFNLSARNSFVSGEAPSLLEAKITRGEAAYRHAFSKFLGSGFRIKVLSGKSLDKKELAQIADVVLANDQLVRKLVALGWDTLEVHDTASLMGIKYPLKKYMNIGGYIN